MLNNEGIIKECSKKLTNEFEKGYTVTALSRMKNFYFLIQKLATVSQQLSYGHYVEFLPFDSLEKIKYYIMIIEQKNLSIRELKVTELKKEHIGQIEVYMNYIDSNLKRLNQNKTIGLIICKKEKQSLPKRNHLLKQHIFFLMRKRGR